MKKRYLFAGAALLATLMILCPGTDRALCAEKSAPPRMAVPPWGAPVTTPQPSLPERDPYRGVPPNETGQEARERAARQQQEQSADSGRPDTLPPTGDTTEHQRERDALR